MPRADCPAASRRRVRLRPGTRGVRRGSAESKPVPTAQIKLEAVMEALRAAHRDAEKLKEQARAGRGPCNLRLSRSLPSASASPSGGEAPIPSGGCEAARAHLERECDAGQSCRSDSTHQRKCSRMWQMHTMRMLLSTGRRSSKVRTTVCQVVSSAASPCTASRRWPVLQAKPSARDT